MRQLIIKKLHARIMNADETANLSYPVWKRRTLMVSAFVALRVCDVAAVLVIPFVIAIAIVGNMLSVMVKIATESASYMNHTFINGVDNIKSDFRGLRNVWSGNYGRGRLVKKNERFPG